MNEKIKIDENLHDEIIAAAYGEASEVVKEKIEKLIKENEQAAELFARYSETAEAVRQLEPEDCPNELIAGVLASQKIGKIKRSFIYDWFSILYSKPAVSAVAGFAVVIVIAATLIFNVNRPQYNGYTKSEVEKANKETQMALNIVGRFFAESKEVLKENILIDKIGRPVQKGINELNKLFLTGGKNEKLIN
ncbi:MAG: hypothetical protein GXO87_14445 [Chlorobi bacterium]|nr:hypothetical protein [Chlorobiota bacterium]